MHDDISQPGTRFDLSVRFLSLHLIKVLVRQERRTGEGKHASRRFVPGGLPAGTRSPRWLSRYDMLCVRQGTYACFNHGVNMYIAATGSRLITNTNFQRSTPPAEWYELAGLGCCCGGLSHHNLGLF